MRYTRLIKPYMRGEDVKAVKDRLVSLGLLYAATHDRFGSDTLRAVKRFQAQNGLAVDGIVGPLTWACLFPGDYEETGPINEEVFPIDEEVAPPDAFDGDLPANIGETAAQAIMADLGGVSRTRLAVVLDALQYAYDPTVPEPYPLSLYIRGGNLYNKDLAPNVITLARIASGAKAQPQYYNGGRREMMESAVRHNPAITGADCSGGIVGLMRHAGLVSPGFDANANTLTAGHARQITRAELIPGDWLHRPQHIGLYAGGGYVVEWVGGAYGCQLTKADNRRVYNFLTRRTQRYSAWTGFMRPTYY